MSFFNRKRKKSVDRGITNIIDPIIEYQNISKSQEQEIATFLLEFLSFLRKLCEYEAQAYVRSHNLEKEKQAEGYSDFAQTDDIKQLWKSYQAAHYDLCKQYCCEHLLQKGYGESFGIPERFHYVNNGCRWIVSLQDDQLLIEAIDLTQLQQHDKFVFVKSKDSYLLSELYFAYPNSDQWHLDII